MPAGELYQLLLEKWWQYSSALDTKSVGASPSS